VGGRQTAHTVGEPVAQFAYWCALAGLHWTVLQILCCANNSCTFKVLFFYLFQTFVAFFSYCKSKGLPDAKN